MPEVTFEILIILLLILLNGLFAMAEIAVVSAGRVRLQQRMAQGDSGAEVALQLAEAPNRFLSTVQVGITLIGVLAGAFGGANIAGELAGPLGELPWIGRYASAISLAIVVGTITFLTVVLGELVPKRIALHSAERVASLIARPMHVLSIWATPAVRLLSISTDMVLGLLGIDASSEVQVSEEEIRVLVEQGAQAGIIEEAERDMVESVFRLGDRPLEAMMTPRTEIAWLDVNAAEEASRNIIEESGHTRFPVCDGDLDHVSAGAEPGVAADVGDLVAAQHRRREPVDASQRRVRVQRVAGLVEPVLDDREHHDEQGDPESILLPLGHATTLPIRHFKTSIVFRAIQGEYCQIPTFHSRLRCHSIATK
jgi:putative hemolysin